MKTISKLFLVSLFTIVSSAFATPPALEMSHSIDLNDYRGKTFLEAMTVEGGIKAQFDDDYETTYTVVNSTAINKALYNFDTKVVNKVLRSFEDGKVGLKELAETMEGKKFKPSNMVNVIRPNIGRGADMFGLAQFFAMASGAGTLVQLNDDNYYYNYGYKTGEEADDVKSGRSFGAGPGHNANDASDTFYLRELGKYVTGNTQTENFYKSLMDVILQCDTSAFDQESEEGQTVATDFIAIYTAELDRHIMVNLNPRNHPWENDLAEVTFLTAFGTAVGKVMKEGELIDGEPTAYWEKSKVSNRSGIGITRTDRRKLQKIISDYERENNPEVVEAVENLIDGTRPNGDVYQEVMEFINNYKTQTKVKRNADKLSEAFINFLMQTRKDAKKILNEIQ